MSQNNYQYRFQDGLKNSPSKENNELNEQTSISNEKMDQNQQKRNNINKQKEIQFEKNSQKNIKPNYNKIKIQVCHNDPKETQTKHEIENLQAVIDYKSEKYKKKKKLFQEKIEYYETQNKQNIDRLFQLQKQKDELQICYQQLQDQNYQIQHSNEQTINSLQNMINNFKNQKKEQFSELNEQIHQLKQQCQKNQQNSDCENEVKSLQQHLIAEKDNNEKEIKKMVNIHAELLNEKISYQNKNQELQNQLNEHKKKLNDKDLYIQSLNLEKNQISNKLTQLEKYSSIDIIQQNQNQQQQIILLQDQINNLNVVADDYESLQVKYKDVTSRFEKMKSSSNLLTLVKMQVGFTNMFSRGASMAQSRQGNQEPIQPSQIIKKTETISEDMFDQS